MKTKRATVLGITLLALSIAIGTMGVVTADTSDPGTSDADTDFGIVGVRFEIPVSPPSVAMEEAIEVAKSRLGAVASNAAFVEARYVLFSDDQYYRTDANGQKHYFFQNVPAWVVTFKGVKLQSRGRSNHYNEEIHVVVNAITGEYMELFSFR